MHAIIFSMATSQAYLLFLVSTVNTARTRYLLSAVGVGSLPSIQYSILWLFHFIFLLPQCEQHDLSYTDAS